MTGPTIFDRGTVVKLWFGSNVANDEAFTLDDPTLGLLDGAGLLTGDTGTDIARWVYDIQVTRGRSRELDEFQAGVCTLRMRNVDRAFDPMNAEYILDEDGNYILDEDGNYILTEGSVYAPALVPGRRLKVEVYGQTIYDGSTEDWTVTYEPHFRTDASVVAVDNLGTLARRQLDAHTAPPGQTAGQRIVTIINRPGVSFGYTRDIDPGVTTMQADDITWRKNVLSYLQTVAKSDFGMLFASRTNTLTYRDRSSRRTNVTPDLAFSTEGDGLPIYGLELTVGSELFYNSVGVDRDGGTLQTAEDAESAELYGVRSLALSGLLMDTDTEAMSMAEWLLRIYKDPTERVAAIRVNLSALPTLADRAAVAALDIGSVVSVTAQPLNTGAVLEQTSIIEGIDHSIGHGQPHVMTLRLSPLEPWQATFILDDPVYGVLDSADSLLVF